ncbi:MAG: hypothetical protein EOM18_16875 [Clostridia bacterium]|nr:hypothetical protein [Clostridia bacterium]
MADAALAGETLQIYRSAFGETWEANTPDASCIVTEQEEDFEPKGFVVQRIAETQHICEFQTDHLSYFTMIQETTAEDITTTDEQAIS